jgi:hypothetical protein
VPVALKDVTAHANGSGSSRIGVYNTASVEAHDSQIIGTDISIDNVGGSAVAYVSNTELSPAVAGTSTTFNCVSAYSELFAVLTVHCA